MATILVAMAAFNEGYIKQTAENLLANKSGRHEIIINVCDFRTTNFFPELDRPEIVHFRHISSVPTGVGVTRSMALKNCEMFDYVMQIDAHMQFGKNWDENLVDRHRLLEAREGKCVITQHLPALIAGEDGIMHADTDRNHLQGPVRLFFNDQCRTWSEPWETTESKWYEENSAVSAAFMFSKSETFSAIPPDPLIFFFGEEHTLYMRLISRGIKSFSTDYCDVRHLDKGKDFFTDKKKGDWRTFSFAESVPQVSAFERFSHGRAGLILVGKITGLWGAPNDTAADDALRKMHLDEAMVKSVFNL